MMEVKLPTNSANIGGRAYTAVDALLEIVMTRPGWRKAGNTKPALSIMDKIDKSGDALTLVLTDREHELLIAEAQMPEATAVIAPREANRVYLAMLDALYDARPSNGTTASREPVESAPIPLHREG